MTNDPSFHPHPLHLSQPFNILTRKKERKKQFGNYCLSQLLSSLLSPSLLFACMATVKGKGEKKTKTVGFTGTPTTTTLNHVVVRSNKPRHVFQYPTNASKQAGRQMPKRSADLLRHSWLMAVKQCRLYGRQHVFITHTQPPDWLPAPSHLRLTVCVDFI
jgi:hypothetical protein